MCYSDREITAEGGKNLYILWATFLRWRDLTCVLRPAPESRSRGPATAYHEQTCARLLSRRCGAGRSATGKAVETVTPCLRRIDSRLLLAQRLRKPNESLPNRSLIEGGKAEDQCLRVRTPQGVSINGENFNTLGRRQLFRLP
jgi:hypothetical protein